MSTYRLRYIHLCHVWSTDLDSHFLSVDRGESMYIHVQGMLCAYMYYLTIYNKCGDNVLLLVPGLVCAYTCTAVGGWGSGCRGHVLPPKFNFGI